MIDLSKMQLRRVVAMAATDAGTAVWQLACGHVYHYASTDPAWLERHRRDIEAHERGDQFVRRCTGCEQGHTPRHRPGEVNLLEAAAALPVSAEGASDGEA